MSTTASTTPATDSIERTIELSHAPSRVWKAITTPNEFSAWFGVTLENEFVPGQPTYGRFTNSAKYAHVRFEFIVEEITPETRFSYRWRPFALEEGVDYSHEPRTLVTFDLLPTATGTRLTVTESGFDGIPLARRGTAFEMNSRGWTAQIANIERYLTDQA